MRIGIIGLGRMGMHMCFRLVKEKHEIVVFNRSPEKIKEAVKQGAIGSASLADFAKKLGKTKIVWLMVPAGDPVDEMITGLLPSLNKGDIIIDGGNSNYQDSARRAEFLKLKGVSYLDCGTSGGLGGEKTGYCLMVGGEKAAYTKLVPIFKALSAKEGYFYTGPSGSGHYVKMIHNGIEYALLQSYAEGFELLTTGPYKIDLPGVAELWNHGSVIRSWLLELGADALKKDPTLQGIEDFVGGGSTGTWTVEESLRTGTPSPMIGLALALRFRTRQKSSFAGKMVSALRNGFGGHETVKKQK
ncbi:MAG: decarboxylating 6-phosphogluconate dehydrogenase [Nanoarchaeota archaeon]|nr:decarboxylating 6-phosphogluconate dehydrogenase [Nanoarchaeota archaeon]